MVTFLDTSKVRPTKVRGEDTWGRTWLKAGFEHVGQSESGLMALQLRPSRFPAAREPWFFVGPHADYRSEEDTARERAMVMSVAI
jgi:hypothetical protein